LRDSESQGCAAARSLTTDLYETGEKSQSHITDFEEKLADRRSVVYVVLFERPRTQ